MIGTGPPRLSARQNRSAGPNAGATRASPNTPTWAAAGPKADPAILNPPPTSPMTLPSGTRTPVSVIVGVECARWPIVSGVPVTVRPVTGPGMRSTDRAVLAAAAGSVRATMHIRSGPVPSQPAEFDTHFLAPVITQSPASRTAVVRTPSARGRASQFALPPGSGGTRAPYP